MTIAGWYPDPSGRHSHRWWDGAAWTEHVADRPAKSAPTEHVADRPAEPRRPAEPELAEPEQAEHVADEPAEPELVGAPRGVPEAVGARRGHDEPDHAGPIDAGAGDPTAPAPGGDPNGYDPEAPFDREPTPVDGRPRERAAAYWADVVARTDPDDLRVQPGSGGTSARAPRPATARRGRRAAPRAGRATGRAAQPARRSPRRPGGAPGRGHAHRAGPRRHARAGPAGLAGGPRLSQHPRRVRGPTPTPSPRSRGSTATRPSRPWWPPAGRWRASPTTSPSASTPMRGRPPRPACWLPPGATTGPSGR